MELENMYDCDICQKAFSKKRNLTKHITLHNSNREYKCDQCNKSYTRSDHLKRHKISHSDNPKPIQCDHCLLRFSDRAHMSRHVKFVHLNTQYECDECNLQFNKKSKLNRHIFTHTNTKPYTCDWPLCSKTFFTQGKLNYHLKKHQQKEQIKQPRLVKLGKRLILKQSTKQYRLCPYEGCLRNYTSNYNLKVHIRCFHLGLKLFKCEYGECNQQFMHKCSLEKHLKLANHFKEITA